MEVEVDGRVIPLTKSGTEDGRFSGTVTFQTLGEVPVLLHAKSSLLDKSIHDKVNVSGYFRYSGVPLEIDLGSFKAPGESCREFRIDAEQSGVVPFDLRAAQSLPGGQGFEIRGPHGSAKVRGSAMLIGAGDALELCLKADRGAESSSGAGEHWLDLVARVGSSSANTVPIRVRWNLRGLTWWERWRWLILSLLSLLILIFWIYGYIKPNRFPRNLALTFVPEREELYEQTPQPIAQWKGVGIGWYLDARAFLHPNFRLSGSQRGSLASLHALNGGFRIRPEGGTAVFRETVEGDWEALPLEGRRSTHGQAYRVADMGPYFLVTTRRTGKAGME